MTAIQIAAIRKIKEALEAIEKDEADGCLGCVFGGSEEWELPCAKCKRNSKDYWRSGEVEKELIKK